jgi:hypothetical protein
MSGFDIILGNPPWEMLEVDEDSSIALQNRTRGFQKFSSESLRFPLGGRGRRNIATLFVEFALTQAHAEGRIGLVIPTSVVTDKPSEILTRFLLVDNRIIFCFDKENAGDFPAVHGSQRYSALTLAGRSAEDQPRFAFLLDSISDIREGKNAWSLKSDEILEMCETRCAIPCFQDSVEADITARCYSNGITINAIPSLMGLSLASGLFYNFDKASKAVKLDREALPGPICTDDFSPVFEGEYFHGFDHRFATYDQSGVRRLTEEEKNQQGYEAVTATWVAKKDLGSRWQQLSGKTPTWVLALRRQARATDETTAISAILPQCASEGSVSCFFGDNLGSSFASSLVACLNSFLFNYLLRKRQSGANVSKTIYSQLPLPIAILKDSEEQRDSLSWIDQRVLELSYTSNSLSSFARDQGHFGLPFRWDSTRRRRIRDEIEAKVFLEYGIERDHILLVMDAFPIVQRKDIAEHGAYRTKERILEIYDEMATCRAEGTSWESPLNPPPGDLRATHNEDLSTES